MTTRNVLGFLFIIIVSDEEVDLPFSCHNT